MSESTDSEFAKKFEEEMSAKPFQPPIEVSSADLAKRRQERAEKLRADFNAKMAARESAAGATQRQISRSMSQSGHVPAPPQPQPQPQAQTQQVPVMPANVLKESYDRGVADGVMLGVVVSSGVAVSLYGAYSLYRAFA